MKNFKLLFTSILMIAITFCNGQKNNVIPTGVTDSLGKHIKEASSTVYQDSKDLLKYSGNVLEKSIVRLDTILNHGYKQISKGAVHTFQVLKTQQLVKSFHHLFYFISGIFLTIVFFKELMDSESSNEGQFIKLLAIGILTSSNLIYNAMHFMEMWTGFMNPEYGVYLEILELVNKQKYGKYY
jgi:hypothetical protein